MSFPKWRIHPEEVFSVSSVIPVLVIKKIEQALPLADALFAGGIKVLEVTLRTPVALEAIQLLTNHFPDALIGAGTVVSALQLQQVSLAGAKFAISPGHTHTLLQAGAQADIALIPGIASVSEMMNGLESGYSHFKFFPAAVAGGIPMLRALYGPFPEVHFCPTGGINEANYKDYLALPNVACVGGSWIVPDEAIQNKDWSLITNLSLSVSNKAPLNN